MEILTTKLAQVLILKPQVFQDQRGFFLEVYNTRRFEQAGIGGAFTQDNVSYSTQNVIRGLHYQLRYPQGKLVSALYGKIFDVIVDLRHGSPTYGAWIGVELSHENNWQIYIPPGCAHGFMCLSAEAIVHYKCTQYYHPEDEYGILWSDSELDIAWPIPDIVPNVSPKDLAWPVLAQIPEYNLPNY